MGAVLEGEELAYLGIEDAQGGRAEPFPDDLDPRVASALVGAGHHRALAAPGRGVGGRARAAGTSIVTTGTASGKSLAFNLPVLDLLARDPKSRALYLYPTKALAQDQARALAAFGLKGVKPAIYDGDTETERRWQIRKWANVVLTNPDMLHVGVLPHHDRWGDVLANLRFVVVDEAHVYRGVFGSHVANVLRRLRRLARAYGSEPQFVLASATIANAGELAESLLGGPATRDRRRRGAARRARRSRSGTPSCSTPSSACARARSATPRGSSRASRRRGLRTICFAKSRKAVELIHRFTVDRVDADVAERLAPYRAGYTPAQRREIERRLMAGELLGVSATDALELGIDIGELDCAISVGFPGTVSSLRQQWGRAGRRGRGLAVLIASEDALDQFFMRDPEALLGRTRRGGDPRRHEPARARRARALGRVRRADRRGRRRDARPGGARARGRAARAEADEGRLGLGRHATTRPRACRCARPTASRSRSSTRRRAPCSASSSARARSRRSTRAPSTSISASSTSCGRSISRPDGARLARRRSTGTHRRRRRPRRRSWSRCGSSRGSASTLHFGRVSVTEQVVAYQRKSISGGDTLETVPLDLPETSFETEAIWFCPTSASCEGLDEMPTLLSSLHAAEHSLIALLPLWAMCDRWDIGGLSTNIHLQTGLPTIFVYDGHAGGVGITERGFERFEGWVADTARMLTGCPCAAGCPSCVQSPKCGNLNEFLDKAGR